MSDIKRVGLAGFGAIGQRVAIGLEQSSGHASLAAITSRDLVKAQHRAHEILRNVPPVVSLDETIERSDLIVEAAPAEAFLEIASPTLRAGKSLLVLSVGALLGREDNYSQLAQRYGGIIYVVSGAIGGLDAIGAAAVGQLNSVTLVSRKPPRGLSGAPYLIEKNIDLSCLKSPQIVFEGSAREACRGFPANVNISAAISLAGMGPDRTQVRIIADPTINCNIHDVDVKGEFGEFTIHIENRPTDNPRTGILTALSVLSAIRKLTSALRVGT